MAKWNLGITNIVDKINEQCSPFPAVPTGIEKLQLLGELC